MQAKLVIVGGKANKRDVLLKLPTVIGRSREADLTVAHPMVSRKHCELFEVDGLLKIRDLGSLNGTLVAGERITEAELRPDDEFTVGPLTFCVDYEYAGEIAAAPPAGEAAEEAPDFQILGDEENLPETEPSPARGGAGHAGGAGRVERSRTRRASGEKSRRRREPEARTTSRRCWSPWPTTSRRC